MHGDVWAGFLRDVVKSANRVERCRDTQVIELDNSA